MVDKSGNRVRRMFGEIAPGYDRMNHLLSMNVDRLWRWKTVRILKPQAGDRILDVCTGTGDLAFSFAKSHNGACHVDASDFCREMLEIGEQKRIKRNVENVSFAQADAQQLPYPDNTFDFVSVAFGLRNVADTDRGLRELSRVTKVGGKVAVLEFSNPRWQPFKSLYGFYFDRILPRIGQFLARNQSDAYKYLPESVGEFPCYEALVQRMQAAKMEHVSFRPFSFGIATLYVGTKSDAVNPESGEIETRQKDEAPACSSGASGEANESDSTPAELHS